MLPPQCVFKKCGRELYRWVNKAKKIPSSARQSETLRSEISMMVYPKMDYNRQGLLKLSFPDFASYGRFVKELKKTLIKVIGDLFSLDKLFHRWNPHADIIVRRSRPEGDNE